jgi:hypothetical protein
MLKDAESVKLRNAQGFIDSTNPLPVDLVGGDIQIGAIEIKDATTDQRAIVNADGQLHVVLMGKVDDGNSTSTPLNSGIVFTGTAFDTLDFGFIFVTIFSDVASATNGLSFQQSSDGTNWDNTDDFNYIAGTGKTYSIQPGAEWFRIVYTNGGINQSAFRLQTIFKKTSSLPSSHRISDNLSVEDDATLGIAVIKGQKPSGDYVDFNATAGGNFKMSLEEYDSAFTGDPLPVREPLLSIARNLVTGMFSVNKFGRNIEIDSGVTADIWDGGHRIGAGGVSLIWVAPTQTRIHAIVSTSDEDSDTGGIVAQGDGARTIRVFGLTDWDTNEVSEDIIMDGTNAVNTSNSYVIIHRILVLTKGDDALGPNVGVITATAATDGTVTAQIRVSQGQTQMAIYGVPSTQKAYIGRIYANVNKSGGAAGLLDVSLLSNPEPDNELTNFLTKHTFGLQTVGTSAFTIPYYTPKVIEGPTIIKIQTSSNTNDMDVSAGFDLVLVNN